MFYRVSKVCYDFLGWLEATTRLALVVRFEDMSLHDVCVFIPSWFGVVSTIFLELLTYECTRCVDSSVSGSCNKGVEMGRG